MAGNRLEVLEKLLKQGQDSALLRFGLGRAYLETGRIQEAAQHLEAAVTLDPGYSAAWKYYAQALVRSGRIEEAAGAYERGIAAAEGRGDLQAAKEMTVFLKRLRRAEEKNAPT
ncbi:MAG: tetratricopeptide repeat protein [Pseudomonadota bacterium]|nr:tetratricopeptide repeat protein [Pseudomonadota bacterium]